MNKRVLDKRVVAAGVAVVACAAVAIGRYLKRIGIGQKPSDLVFSDVKVECSGREGVLGGRYAAYKVTGLVTNNTKRPLFADSMPVVVADVAGSVDVRASLSQFKLASGETCSISYEGELAVKDDEIPNVSFSCRLTTEGLRLAKADLNVGLAQVVKEFAEKDAAERAAIENKIAEIAAEATEKQEAAEQAKKSLEACEGKTADEGLQAAKDAGYSATFKDKAGADVTSAVEDSNGESDVRKATIASVDTLSFLGNYVAFTLDYTAPDTEKESEA